LSMDIAASVECFNECRILGEMSQQSQLDLRIIGCQQLPPRAWYEPAPNIAP
jgi:hypothetical protein